MYLATDIKAISTFKPDFAEVSMKVTEYSLANCSPSSRFIILSLELQSALFPVRIENRDKTVYIIIMIPMNTKNYRFRIPINIMTT